MSTRKPRYVRPVSGPPPDLIASLNEFETADDHVSGEPMTVARFAELLEMRWGESERHGHRYKTFKMSYFQARALSIALYELSIVYRGTPLADVVSKIITDLNRLSK